jgi:hypothetical protein
MLANHDGTQFVFLSDHPGKHIHIAVSNLAGKDLIAVLMALCADKQLDADGDLLLDLSNAAYVPTTGEPQKVAGLLAVSDAFRHRRLAVIVRSAVQFGMVELISFLAGGNINMSPFYSVNDAVEWLKGDLNRSERLEVRKAASSLRTAGERRP